MEFDVGKWLGKSVIVPGNFSDLMSYIESKDLLRAHVASRKGHGIDGPVIISEMAEPVREFIIAGISENIVDASERASAQMVVLAVTYIEGMLSEFFSCLFYYNLKKMHDYVSIGKCIWCR